jgi:phage tail-like protein
MVARQIGLVCAATFFATIANAQESEEIENDLDKVTNPQGQATNNSSEDGLLNRIASFVVNTTRRDPYKPINFRVRMDGRYIPGVSYVSPISRKTQAVSFRSGGDAANQTLAPGLTKIQPIVLKRGVTHDPTFENWADQVWSVDGPGAVSLKNYRRDLVVELQNLSGQTVKAYLLYRCWPTQYTALSALDADANSVAEESLTIQCEGWERDEAVVEPTEP